MEATSVDNSSLGFPPGLLACPTFLLSKLGMAAKAQTCTVLSDTEELAPGHLGIIFSLAEFGPISQKELASSLHYDASDVVAYIDELEKRGWAERNTDPVDRRRYAVTLTAEGRKAHRRLEQSMQELNDAFMAALSEQERKAAYDLMRRLLASHDSRVPQS